MNPSMIKWIFVVLFVWGTLGNLNERTERIVSQTFKLDSTVTRSTISLPQEHKKVKVDQPANRRSSSTAAEINHATSKKFSSTTTVDSTTHTSQAMKTSTTATSPATSTALALNPVRELKVSPEESTESSVHITFRCPNNDKSKIDSFMIEYEPLNNTGTTSKCQSIEPCANVAGITVPFEDHVPCKFSQGIPVTADTKYLFTVYAVNTNSRSSANTTYVAKAGASDPVTDLQLTNVTSTNATLHWSPPLNSRGNILAYEVRCTTNKRCSIIQLTCIGGKGHVDETSSECKTFSKVENTFTIKDYRVTYKLIGLTPDTQYSVDVSVINSYGRGANQSKCFKTLESAPERVENLNVSAVKNNSSEAEVTFSFPRTPSGKIINFWIMYEALNNTDTTNQCQTITPTENKIGMKVQVEESSSCKYSVKVQVTADTQYRFKVFAVNKYNGSCANKTYVAKSSVSDPVTDLNVTNVTSTSATVHWSPPVHSRGKILAYEVRLRGNLECGKVQLTCVRNEDNDNEMSSECELFEKNNLGTFTDNQVTYELRSLTPYTDYSVDVFVINSNGKSGNKSKSFKTSESGPGPVRNLTLTPLDLNYTAVTVSFSSPLMPNGVITKYVLSYYMLSPGPTNPVCELFRQITNNTGMEILANSTRNGLYSKAVELSPATTYFVQVTAFNSFQGIPAVINFTTETKDPGPVTSLNFSPLPGDYSSLMLHFNSLSPGERHGNVKHYIIKYTVNTETPDSKCGMSAVIQNTTGITILDDGSCNYSRRVAVTPERHYNFSIQAFNSLPGKITFYATFTPYGPPDKVGEIKPRAITDSSVTVQWTTPQHVNGMIHSYQLTVELEGKCVFRDFTDCGDFSVNQENRKPERECKSTGTTPSIGNIIHNGDLHHIIVNDLLSYTNYTISVVPINTNGPGPGAHVQFTTVGGVPDEPKNFHATVDNSSTITLFWSPSKHQAGPTNYTIIVNGNVDKRTNNCTDVGTINVPGFHTSSTVVDNLCSYTNYAITIMAITSAGNSSRVSINQTVQTGIGIPDEPNNFYPNVSSSATITLFWSPSEHQAGPTNYTIDIIGNVDQKKNNCADVDTINVTGFHTSSIVVDNLCSYTNYSFTITAITSAGKSSCVSGNTVKTHTEAADPPHGLRVEKVTPSSVELSWVHSKHQCGLTDYIVEVEERSHLKDEFYIPNGTITVHGFHNNTVYIGNLISYWKYNFSVRARTSVNPVSSSIYAEVQTSQSPPGVVRNIQVSALPDNYTAVKLTWECPEERERHGPISSFTVQYPDKKFTFDHFPDGYPCRKPQIELHSAVLPVHPEKTYEFTVFASAKYEGWKTVSVSFCAKAGKPPKENSTKIFLITPSVTSETTTESTFPVTVNTDLLRDSTNGRIVMIGLLVMKDTAIVDVPENLTSSSLMNWRGWKEWKKDYKGTYRPTPDNWLIPQIRRKRSTDSASNSTTRFIVGNDNCESKEHCNGPVEADTSYRVIAVSCTNVGCSSSTPFGPFRTKAKSVAAAAVGGVLAALVVVGIVIGGLVYRRQRNRKRHHHGDDPNKQEEVESVNKTRPKKLSDFSPLVDEYHKDSGRLFAEEWREIGLYSPSHPYENATLEVNREKNRYTNILAYDQTRVKLLPKTEDDGSDYINANFILGFSRPREYIASQGPVPGTLEDFWQMIWEQNVPIIVQLTDLYEGGRRKLSRYWPEEVNVPETFGEVQVETVSLSPMNKYTIKVFNVSVGSKSRQVKHFFLQGWQDYNANLKTGDVIDFARYVRNELKPTDKGPMVVHCSAGVGRTGTFICVDYFLQVINKADLEDSIDIFSFVLKMRDCRPLMVQSESQYVFVHDAVKEMIERKKKALAGVDEVLYENQAFDPEDDEEDNIYENT